jgi:hypothetical protein
MAKNRFAAGGLNQKDEAIFVALELNVNSMNIEVKHFTTSGMKDEEIDLILKKY